MSKRRKPNTSQADFQNAAKSAAPVIALQAKRLGDVASFLTKTDDFSPHTLRILREVIEDMAAVETTCKRIRDISLKRGNTYYDEQKAALASGSLKLNRRDLSEAAE